MTYVVVGATGLLGGHIARLLAIRRLPRVLFGHSAATGNGHVSFLDIREPAEIDAAMRRAAPRVVINATHAKDDWHTTATGPANLARACREHGAHLIHISSDAVFSGAAPVYDESSAPDPRTPYGAAKAAAETAISMFGDVAVVRTSWLVGGGVPPLGVPANGTAGPGGGGLSWFERFVRDVAAGNTGGGLYADDIATPLHAADLARAVLEIADQRFTGTVHVAGGRPMSRYDLGVAYAGWAGIDTTVLRPGSRYGDDGPVRVVLDGSMAQALLTTRIRPIEDIYPPGVAG